MATILSNRMVVVDDEAADAPAETEMMPASAPATTDAEEEEMRPQHGWAEVFLCCGDDADHPPVAPPEPPLHHTEVLLDDDLFEKADGSFTPGR